eukprot:3540720-Amphidinium_carterae.1
MEIAFARVRDILSLGALVCMFSALNSTFTYPSSDHMSLTQVCRVVLCDAWQETGEDGTRKDLEPSAHIWAQR